MQISYARVSTQDQNLDLQTAALKSAESKPVALSPGVHDIRLDYSQGSGIGSLTLRWNGPDFAREVLSTTQLKKIA